MHNRNATNHEQALTEALTSGGPQSAQELRTRLGLSQPSFSRLVRQLPEDSLLIFGQARSTRYAWRRTLEDLPTQIPIFRVLPDGRSQQFGTLHPIAPEGFYFESNDPETPSQLFSDLPLFLQDLRPAGFLGRLIPQHHPELNAPAYVRHWSAEHCLRYWVRYGWDLVGNIIVGETAFAEHLQQAQQQSAAPNRTASYATIADNIMQHGQAGSSAAGEQPKFVTRRPHDGTPVLVKFAPRGTSERALRIADLLHCESIALRTLAAHGYETSSTRIVCDDGRTMLEVERFDRSGTHGRIGTLSLFALDAEHLGLMRSWTESATALHEQGHISTDMLRTIRIWDLFGALIANTDRHLGNLSFLTSGTSITSLAPCYDMLPMHYMPRHELLPLQPFKLPELQVADADIARHCYAMAIEFWTQVATTPEVSKDFRELACSNAELLQRSITQLDLLPEPS